MHHRCTYIITLDKRYFTLIFATSSLHVTTEALRDNKKEWEQHICMLSNISRGKAWLYLSIYTCVKLKVFLCCWKRGASVRLSDLPILQLWKSRNELSRNHPSNSFSKHAKFRVILLLRNEIIPAFHKETSVQAIHHEVWPPEGQRRGKLSHMVPSGPLLWVVTVPFSACILSAAFRYKLVSDPFGSFRPIKGGLTDSAGHWILMIVFHNIGFKIVTCHLTYLQTNVTW